MTATATLGVTNPDPTPASPGRPEPVRPGPPEPAPREMLDERAEAGYARGVGAFSLFWYASVGVIVIPLLGRYRHPALPIAVWLVMGVVAIVAVRRIRRGPLTGREAGGLVAAVILAELLVATQCRGYNIVGYANWPALSCSGLLALVVASRPAREWTAAAALFSGVLVVEALVVAGSDPLAVSRLASAIFATWTVMILVALTHRALRSTARAGAAAAEAEIALATAQSAQAAVRAGRRATLDVLEARTLPLVRSLAEGRLDPLDADVRARCGVEAASLRRLLTGATATTATLGRLPAAVEEAERHGVRIEFQVVGDLATVPEPVRAKLERPILALLESLDRGSVLVTVLGGHGHASVVATLPVASGATWPPPDRPDIAGVAEESGQTQIEIRTEIADGRATLLVRWPGGDDR
ncbi:MAG: hypothetical protein ACQSGP_00810 [Frankia sp.]